MHIPVYHKAERIPPAEAPEEFNKPFMFIIVTVEVEL